MIIFIKNNGLARRNCTLRLLKPAFYPPALQVPDQAGRSRMTVSDLGRHLTLLSMQSVNRHPVHIRTDKAVGKYLHPCPDYHLVCLWSELCHKDRMSQRKVQPLSLADRIVGNSSVTPKDPAAPVHKIPLSRRFSCRPLDKARVILIRNKADFHTVLFVGNAKPFFFRDLPNLLLRVIPYRHQRP